MDLSWLINALSHPLVTAVIGAVAGAIVGGLLAWIVLHRRMNWEAMIEHFKELKTLVIEPWISGLESSPQTYGIKDVALFEDLLKEHYPELEPLYIDYNETEENVRTTERTLREDILNRVEKALNNKEIEFEKEHSGNQDVCVSSYVANFAYRVMEQNHWYAHICVVEDKSGSLYTVRLNGTHLYKTSTKYRAEEVRSVLENLTKQLVIMPELTDQMRKLKELRRQRLKKLDELRMRLRDIRRKPKLKLRKRLWVFPRPCKYLKP